MKDNAPNLEDVSFVSTFFQLLLKKFYFEILISTYVQTTMLNLDKRISRAHIGPLTEVPSSSADIASVLRGFFRAEPVNGVSLRFEAKENLELCGDVFLYILNTSMGVSANSVF